ncbi:MAG: hypothetical protein M3Z04_06830 [Chloroflexota bacterium]|nr:hypothetical protein [Chloroflexota bacterium]
MEKLQQQLDALIARLENAEELRAQVRSLVSVYPFNEFEYIIVHLLAANELTLDEYHEMRADYIYRNLYLPLFEISAPRGFGELWAQGHLRQLVPALQRPTKQLDPEYGGQYDFWLPPRIRIEVKASRAVEANRDAPLYVKALSADSAKPFDMNFQQIKPRYCDVLVWIGVWRDDIKYWVIPSFAVENSSFYSKGQHRGNIGEGQLHINHLNISRFDPYLVQSTALEQDIHTAFAEEQRLRQAE